jgi:alpha-methylacyl-CoA racemase
VLLGKLGLDPAQYARAGFPAGRTHWPELQAAIAAAIHTRTRDEWTALVEGSDACLTPVLSLAEAARHPHNVARGSFITVDGIEQNAPAPRFSRSVAGPVQAPAVPGADTEAVLAEAGFDAAQIAALRSAGAVS